MLTVYSVLFIVFEALLNFTFTFGKILTCFANCRERLIIFVFL